MSDSGRVTRQLSLMAKLMELHGENPFKTRAYSNAAFRLSKLRYDFNGKSLQDIESIDGLGKSIASKVFDLASGGTIPELDELLGRTPEGVVHMLEIKGLGPRKVFQLWQELNCESVGELLYACHENRLVTLKGFGEKTQRQVLENIEFSLAGRNKMHYAAAENAVGQAVSFWRSQGFQAVPVGQFARREPVLDGVQILVSGPENAVDARFDPALPLPVKFISCPRSEFYYRSVEMSSAPAHLAKIGFSSLAIRDYQSEEAVYDALGLQFVPPELREGLSEAGLARSGKLPRLIENQDLRGILHCHTTYSDGANTLRDMALECRRQGYSYFGVCDHSKSAFYANGLSEERVVMQHAEIDKLNSEFSDFRILKGIESDILSDGSLDYPDAVLSSFDFIVASVHQNLKMSEERATERLIRAIENPFTFILGHPTGRLLLGRPGYPIDHRRVIDACAANGVSIELNSHPYRLDIDWRWIPYCIEKGVKVSLNPDAHHLEGLKDVRYGVFAARKGMLSRENCLNALELPDLIRSFRRS